MNTKRMKTTALALLIILAAGLGFAGQEKSSETLARQVKELAVSLAAVDPQADGEDLKALEDVIGDASIVCLGESQHLLHEQYQLKHRVVRYLVEKMGFTHIAIEDSLYGTIAIDEYIKGADTSPEDVLRKTGGWYLWETEEMVSLLRWLRAHNDRMKDGSKVSYVGLDIQDPWPGFLFLMDYFLRVDPPYADSLKERSRPLYVFNKPMWMHIKSSYPKLPREQKQAIGEAIDEILERLETRREPYIEAGGAKAHADAVLVARHLVKSHEFFLELEEADPGEVGLREKTMFANVVRLRETSGPRARIIVWVHNAHAARSPVRFLNTGIPESAELELLGTMLKGKYGDEVKSIGMASPILPGPEADFEGRPDVLDHVLTKTGLDLFFLDFAGMKGGNGKKSPLAAPWKLTADMGGFLSLVPADAYDGLFFVKHITPVRRSPEADRRFKALF